MKKLIILIGVALSLSVYGQAPAAFKYQAVVRAADGKTLPDAAVSFRISVLENDLNGPVAFSEVHNVTTTNYGMVNLHIGDGSNIMGDLAQINWGQSAHFLKIELDRFDGMSYVHMGTSPLLSVPYALHAEMAGPWEKTSNGLGYHDGYLDLGDLPSSAIGGDGPLRINYQGNSGGGIRLRNHLSSKNTSITMNNDTLVEIELGITGSQRYFPGGNNYGFFVIKEHPSSGIAPGGLVMGNENTSGKIIFIDNGQPVAEFIGGDFIIKDPARGVVLKAPNGTCYRLQVDNAGTLNTTSIPCPN